MFLRINRFGRVETGHQSPNQCKDVAHKEYRYHVALACCATNLDRNEFIVDHIILHNEMEKLFQKEITSCEGMVIKMKERLLKVANKHGIQVVDLYVKLQPIIPGVPSENIAFMELSLSGKFI